MCLKIKNFFRKIFRRDGRVYHPTTKKPSEPEFSSSTHKLYYPKTTPTTKMVTQGKYRLDYPEGIVIHFTAGRDDPLSARNYMASKKLVAIILDKQGHVWQDFPLDEWGWHAGRSSWRGFSGSLNDDFVGIEVICGGKLKEKRGKWYTWFNEVICDFRLGPEVANCEYGCYERFTDVQEEELIKLVVWLIKNSHGKIKVENLVGHDEIAPGRKSDPGWSLSLTMRAFRNKIAQELKK